MFSHFSKRKTTGMIAIVIACIAGASAYAFTASNTVTDHIAGSGFATVSGYTVTGPTDYTFSADGTTVKAVSFQLDNAATDVAAALSAAAAIGQGRATPPPSLNRRRRKAPTTRRTAKRKRAATSSR